MTGTISSWKTICAVGLAAAALVTYGVYRTAFASAVPTAASSATAPAVAEAATGSAPDFPAEAPATAYTGGTYPDDLPPVRITEVFFGEDDVWAELFVGLGPVDLSDYTLTDLDGDDDRLVFRSLEVPTGSYVVVHWSAGRTEHEADANGNGVRDVYLGGRRTSRGRRDAKPSARVDQLVLVRRGEWIDAVAWLAPGEKLERWEKDDVAQLRSRGLWEGEPLILSGFEGASWVRRDAASPDVTAAAWELAAVPTPGQSLAAARIAPEGSIIITEVHPMAPRNEAFVELRATRSAPEGGIDLSRFVLTDLDGEAVPLSANRLTLAPGDFALVFWGAAGLTENDARGDANGNGVREIYLPASQAPARTGDVLALMLGGKVYDAVAWKRAGEPMPEALEQDLADLAARGIAIAPFELAGPETLIGRRGANFFVTSLATPGELSRLAEAPPRGALLVSEVFPEGASSWVELVATEEVDASLFVLSDLDGRGEAVARDPLTLAPGERLIVRWGVGEDEVDEVGDVNNNGIREAYLVRSRPPSSTTDQLAILFGSEVQDAISWKAEGKEVTEAEAKDLAELRNYPGPIVRPKGASVARFGNRLRALYDPTPGLPNDHYLSRPFGRVRITAFSVARDEEWVEVECLEGPSDISRVIATDLDGEDYPASEEPVTLKRGEKARIYWKAGITETDEVGDANGNGIREVFISDDPPDRTTDQIVLLYRGRMLDAVVYSREPFDLFAYPEQDDVKRLVEAGLWKAEDFRRPDPVVVRGAPVSRVAAGVGSEKWKGS